MHCMCVIFYTCEVGARTLAGCRKSCNGDFGVWRAAALHRSQDDRDQHQRRRGERDKDVSDRDRNGSDRHNQHPHHGNASNIASDRDRAPLRAGSAAPLPPPPPAALPARTPTRPRGPPTRNTYPLLVRLLMAQERPHGVGAVLVRVLRRLHANELLAR